jgi:hypothetical protein
MESKTVVILPEMIDLSEELRNTFGQLEQELAAVAVVRFCQITGVWQVLSKEQIRRTFFSNNPVRGFQNFERYFDLLVDRGHLELRPDSLYQVSDIFVRRCFAGHPSAESLFLR